MSLWLNAFHKNGQNNIFHPICSSNNVTLTPFPVKDGVCFLHLNLCKIVTTMKIIYGFWGEVIKSCTTSSWFSWDTWSWPPKHHAVKKPMGHGRDPDSQGWGPRNTFPSGFQPTARTNSPTICMTHLESGSSHFQEATPANEMQSRDGSSLLSPALIAESCAKHCYCFKPVSVEEVGLLGSNRYYYMSE